jgi:hypothetical protein
MGGGRVYNGGRGGSRLCCLKYSLGRFVGAEIEGATKRFEMDG